MGTRLMTLGGHVCHGRRVVLYLILLTPILALPGLLLMDRVERWAAGDHPQAFRVPRSVPTADSADSADSADMSDTAAGPTGAGAARGRHRPTPRSRVRADPEPDAHRPRLALRS